MSLSRQVRNVLGVPAMGSLLLVAVACGGAEVEPAVDEADMAAGNRIACPTLALWGEKGFPAQASTPLDTWREWCATVEGKGIDAGHFIVEENPRASLDAMLPFLEKHARS